VLKSKLGVMMHRSDSGAQVPNRHEGVAEGPDDALQLHKISTLLIQASSLGLLMTASSTPPLA
jgi:hypothetical protein